MTESVNVANPQRNPARTGFLGLGACLAASLLFLGCDGSSGGGSGTPGSSGSVFPELVSTEYGRLADIYAYRIGAPVIGAGDDRRDTRNRIPTLIAKNVVISTGVKSDELFDILGNARPSANYRFLPFDIDVGHDELLILWDDRFEANEFQAALVGATGTLSEVPPAYREQNTSNREIPVIPRNAAIKLNFDRPLPVDAAFFAANPGALQVLEIRDDPNVIGPAAFRPATFRAVVDGNSIVVDTSLIGGELISGINTTGLNPSPIGSAAANFRIAIPSQGQASPSFVIEPDRIAEFNGLDASGGSSVIRDFRSGNRDDNVIGSLQDSEPPMIVTQLKMGITAVDRINSVLTLNKRLNLVPIRGRIPFVDGGILPSTGLPGGPNAVPTVDENDSPTPLVAGDVLVQEVLAPSGETFTLRAEVIENLDVGREVGGTPILGLTAAGDDGGDNLTARVRVRVPPKVDSLGNEVWFQANALPEGQECVVRARYYEFLGYSSQIGSGQVSDTDRRALFVTYDPPPPPQVPGSGVQQGIAPLSSVALRFTEPLDLDTVAPLDNYMVTNVEAHAGNIIDVMDSAKSATLNVILSRLIDLIGDGTELRLAPPLGHFHQTGTAERYWMHMLLGQEGMTDLSGNPVEIFDFRPPGTIVIDGQDVDVPLESFSVPYDIDPAAEENLVASRIQRFAALDEDGTQPGAFDYFGQFQLENGQLSAAPTTRLSKTADSQNLPSITRFQTGQCVDQNSMLPPNPPVVITPSAVFWVGGGNVAPQTSGLLYGQPSVISTQTTIPTAFTGVSGLFGGMLEPHTDRGSRMQLTYREDDFGLSYHQPEDLNLDVEQMHWAPWNDAPVLFDSFDRYSISLAHSRKRPDVEHSTLVTVANVGDPPANQVTSSACIMNTLTQNSGLNLTFADNVLDAGGAKPVVIDKEYIINPNDAFRAASGVKYIPYPEFSSTYTWRDSRHVSWDASVSAPTGLGGARDAVSLLSAGGDHTASVSSPWSPDAVEDVLHPSQFALGNSTLGIRPGLPVPLYTREYSDFLGDRNLDHDPVALPLLVDISVFPDGDAQVATAGNLMHMAHVGPPWTGTVTGEGYFNSGFVAGFSGWVAPNFRIHSSGGVDAVTGALRPVFPDRESVAKGGVLKDMGLGDATSGLFNAPAGDSHQPWAQIDLVRRVSLVTFGFWDSLRPNQHDLEQITPAVPGLPSRAGRPNFEPLASPRVQDFLVVMDPPANSQPGGTGLAVELRGADVIPTPGLYNPASGAGATDRVGFRGNLLNPNYACEAFRYAGPNLGIEFFGFWDYSTNDQLFGRPTAEGLTPYVTENQLDSIRDSEGFLPRYMNMRLIMENNITSNPALSPSLRSIGVAFRINNSQ